MSSTDAGDPAPDSGTPGAGTPGAGDVGAARPEESSRTQLWRSKGERFLRSAVLVIAAAVVVLALGYLLASFVPRWWAQWLGRRIDGSMVTGTVWGLFLGVVFTFVPLVVAWQAVVRRWIKGWWKAVVMAAALVIALPNLMTLSIVLGTNTAAHAGERILDVSGPGFRAATLWGAIIGVALFAVLVWLTRSNRSRGRRVKDLRTELDHRDRADRDRAEKDRAAEDGAERDSPA